MVTNLTTWIFIRIISGNSGSRMSTVGIWLQRMFYRDLGD
uniref:Uncharacterized protein n=1 Tax=Anguilla anguilla TaxID=7936 RepID=A0A0E9Q131_ANGAN